MRWVHLVLALAFSTVWLSCSSTRWVHPTKKEDQLTADWNACERDWLNLMAKNPGAAGMLDNQSAQRMRLAKCLQQKGWRQIEEE
jgi:hypothetical protein